MSHDCSSAGRKGWSPAPGSLVPPSLRGPAVLRFTETIATLLRRVADLLDVPPSVAHMTAEATPVRTPATAPISVPLVEATHTLTGCGICDAFLDLTPEVPASSLAGYFRLCGHALATRPDGIQRCFIHKGCP